MKKAVLLLLILIIGIASASRPTIITIDSRPQFERGTTKNISISDKGILSRSPQLQRLLKTDKPLILAVATDSKGNIYAGTGNDGCIYKTNVKKDSTLFFDSDELAVSALVTDPDDHVFAGTFPNGKIYKIDPSGQASIFFDPKGKYIWDLQIDSNGALYIATGQPAQIIRIAVNGKKTVLLEPQVEHIRCMAISGETLYAGSSGKALIFKIEKEKQPFVIYDPQTEEVTSLFIADEHTLYASTLGETAAPGAQRVQVKQYGNNNQNQNNNHNGESDDSQQQMTQSVMQAALFSPTAPTSLLKINLNGRVQDYWLGKGEAIQDIFSALDGTVLVGTGKNGKIYKVDDKGAITLLYEMQERHISNFSLMNDKIIVATSNPGHIYLLHPQAADSAQYLSEITDTGMQSNWGKLTFKLTAADKKLQFFSRSGNTEKPDEFWSAWKIVNAKTHQIESPPARFFQWRCDFANDAELKTVTFSFQQVNFPPRIPSIVIHRSGDYYKVEPEQVKEEGIVYPTMLPSRSDKKGFRTVDWLFEDPNYDHVKFDIYYRLLNTAPWFTMKKDWGINFYSWDTAQMADGEYEIKITAHDNSDNQSVNKTEIYEISDAFTVDNSGPQINIKKDKNDAGQAVLIVTAKDDYSLLQQAEYSIDTSDWQKMYTNDGILDDKQETFIIPLPNAVHQVAVKIIDKADNYTVIHKKLD